MGCVFAVEGCERHTMQWVSVRLVAKESEQGSRPGEEGIEVNSQFRQDNNNNKIDIIYPMAHANPCAVTMEIDRGMRMPVVPTALNCARKRTVCEKQQLNTGLIKLNVYYLRRPRRFFLSKGALLFPPQPTTTGNYLPNHPRRI